jgi:hypothetical protein
MHSPVGLAKSVLGEADHPRIRGVAKRSLLKGFTSRCRYSCESDAFVEFLCAAETIVFGFSFRYV